MSADLKEVWVMRNPTGHVHVITQRDPTGGDPLAFGWTITCETLLTPAQAAVLEAATALRDSDDKDDNQWFTSYVELCALKSRVDTLRAQEGENA